jgi:hypothetical protein
MAMVGARQRARRGTVGMGGSEREAEMDGERCRCREFPAAPPWLRKRAVLLSPVAGAGAGCRCRSEPEGRAVG